MLSTIEMKRQNQSSVAEFILLGFSDFPELQEQLFGVFLVVYLVTLLGNVIIIVIISLEQSLHVPMYLFLQNLSVVDVSFSAVIIAVIMPEMLVVLSTEKTSISFISCFAQMYFILFFGGTECFLLGAMAYDRFAAICHPLNYPMIMNKRVFMKLLIMSWALGFMLGTVQASWVFSFPFCGPNEINHISCETPAVLELACADTFLFEIYAFTGTILIVMVPFVLILLSYIRILFAILKMPSATGRQKAFSTCASHLTSVTLFYGTANMTYLQPKSGYSPETKKLMSLSYSLLTPLLNPLIYSLRNSEMKKALMKLWRRKVDSHPF
ncbi:LOW QUALITY PROTEIN: olfactory receptor 10A6-like [Enhydra lutris kenyoni]|uniref:Olfactory receptor n=1 Tax=Enhydra lutris kenyoni TaxID=391180 RepID=A0A2Y9IJI4_ENHLU|nr:LOW QUALITY PROTEIN: olfactory receptor 10A6-like [Enhydra lutris kenyoni]